MCLAPSDSFRRLFEGVQAASLAACQRLSTVVAINLVRLILILYAEADHGSV